MMDVTIEGPSEQFVEKLVKAGRFETARDVVEDALRLSQEREQQTRWLRDKCQRALAEEGEYTDEEVAAYVAKGLDELEAEMEAAKT